MVFKNDNELLFYKGDLAETLRQHLHRISDAVDQIPENTFLSAPMTDLVEEISQKFHIAALELDEAKATMRREETKVDVSHISDRNPFRDPGPIMVAGMRVSISIPYRGDPHLWHLRPNSWSSTLPRAKVRSTGATDAGILEMVYEFPADESPERMKALHEGNLKDIRFYIGNQKTQLASEMSALVQRITAAIMQRKEKLKRHDGLSDVFGIPLVHEDVPSATTVTPSRPALKKRAASGKDVQSWDVFVSHASEDKDTFARPLADALRRKGLNVWFDEFTLKVGDSLRRSIDRGLAGSRFGVVLISPAFLAKEWPQKELDGLVAREVAGQKVILPVWHDITAEEVRAYSPILADRIAASSEKGLEAVVNALIEAIG